MIWRRIGVGTCPALAALFGRLLDMRYWEWRDCIRDALSS